jgi:hypothetical protein
MDVHDKLARITAAYAIYNFRSDDFEKVVPTLDDVELAYALLDGTYSSKRVALDEEAKECERRYSIQEEWFADFQRTLRKHDLMENLSLAEVVLHINTLDRVRAEELALYLRTSRAEMAKLLQLFAVENLLITDVNGSYKPTTKLYKLARILKEQASGCDAQLLEAALENSPQTNQNGEGGDDDIFG